MAKKALNTEEQTAKVAPAKATPEKVTTLEVGTQKMKLEKSKLFLAIGLGLGMLAVLLFGVSLLIKQMVDEPETTSEAGETEVAGELSEPDENEKSTDESAEVEDGSEEEPSATEEDEQGAETAEETPAVTPTVEKPATQPVTMTMAEALNAAALSPMSTGYALLDNDVKTIINTQIYASMSNYDKALALYRYVIKAIKYTNGTKVNAEDVAQFQEKSKYKSYADAENVYLATQAIQTGKGDSAEFAALFFVLTRRAGLESYVVDGQTSQGDYRIVMMRLNGQWYGFDALADALVSESSVKYFGQDAAALGKYFWNYAPATAAGWFEGFVKE